MNIIPNKVVVAGVLVLLAPVLSACGSGSSSADGRVSLVASTDVWGSVAESVAGRLLGKEVSVTSIITDPAADPHSYEADTRTQLALSKADVVVENGGGYDDFVDRMRTSNNGDYTLLNAVDISGKKASAGGELNEHVWYDFPTVQRMADQIAVALGQSDSAHRAVYQANAAMFDAKLAALERTEASIKASYAGAGVAITEPVPWYLLEACGLTDKTPAKLSEAVEEGTDVSPVVLQQTLALFDDKSVKLLAYNAQTTGAETEAVLKAAKENSIAVVAVTETLPKGDGYLTWMKHNLAAVKKALS